jgi:hypothetical protein
VTSPCTVRTAQTAAGASAPLSEADAVAETHNAVSSLEPLIEADNIAFALDPTGAVALSPQHGRDLGTLLDEGELAATPPARVWVSMPSAVS